MTKEDPFLKETEAWHNLKALEEIEKNPQISQRELSSRLGVALGITNSLLKVLARKGLLKIRGENNRSLTYHLTHAGVLAKSALAVRWTLNTVDFYRQARYDVAQKMTAIAAAGHKTVVLYGVGELAEIAVIVAGEAGLEVKGLIDADDTGRESFLGLPIGGENLIGELGPDAVIICDEWEAALLGRLNKIIDSEKVYYLMGRPDEIADQSVDKIGDKAT